jgi:flagellar hook-associated protein 1 FlgK
VDAALSIADSSLNAERTAIAVTAENVANASTPGYVRETATVNALPGDTTGVGDGVAVTSVTQATNTLLSANNYQAQGALSNLTSAQQLLTAIENVFPLGQGTSGSTSTSTNTSIAGQLSTFWSDWDDINADPTAPAPRSEVIQSAQGIVESLNEASTQLSQIGTNASAELANQVGSVNTLLTQAAQLNQSILTVSTGGGDPAQLQDQMNAVLGQLSSFAGVTVRLQSNGTSNVGIGGVNVVAGDRASTLSVTNTTGTTAILASPGGIATPVSSGSIAGLLSGINQYLPQYQADLDSVANNLTTTVNTQLAAGYTASGTSGAAEPLFVGSGAQNIALNPTVVADPTLIAAAASTGAAAANDGSNAQAMAELGSSPTGPDRAYQNLIQSVGSATQSLTAQVGAQTSVANQAQAALSASSGVDLDTELTNLMSYQQNYQASAHMLTTINQTMQSLISAI